MRKVRIISIIEYDRNAHSNVCYVVDGSESARPVSSEERYGTIHFSEYS